MADGEFEDCVENVLGDYTLSLTGRSGFKPNEDETLASVFSLLRKNGYRASSFAPLESYDSAVAVKFTMSVLQSSPADRPEPETSSASLLGVAADRVLEKKLKNLLGVMKKSVSGSKNALDGNNKEAVSNKTEVAENQNASIVVLDAGNLGNENATTVPSDADNGLHVSASLHLEAAMERILDKKLEVLVDLMIKSVSSNKIEDVVSDAENPKVGNENASIVLLGAEKQKAVLVNENPNDADNQKAAVDGNQNANIVLLDAKKQKSVAKPKTNKKSTWKEDEYNFLLASLIRNGNSAKMFDAITSEWELLRSDSKERTLRAITQRYLKLVDQVRAIKDSGIKPEQSFVSPGRFEDLVAVIDAIEKYGGASKKEIREAGGSLSFWKENCLMHFGISEEVVDAAWAAGGGVVGAAAAAGGVGVVPADAAAPGDGVVGEDAAAGP